MVEVIVKSLEELQPPQKLEQVIALVVQRHAASGNRQPHDLLHLPQPAPWHPAPAALNPCADKPQVRGGQAHQRRLFDRREGGWRCRQRIVVASLVLLILARPPAVRGLA